MEREINGKNYRLVGINKSSLESGEGCKGCAFDSNKIWCGKFIDDVCCQQETKDQEFIWKLIEE
jgi:hypothetical protein